MRLTDRNCLRRVVAPLAIAMTFSFAAMPLVAQQSLPSANADEVFKDTSMLKPPPGARIAIIEWQDLTCPACAYAFPIVHGAIAHYNIPLIEKDFLLGGEHAMRGDLEAALWARYLQDKVSPKTADDYRGAVFAAQNSIANKDDMLAFTRRFFQSHGLQMPFVADPTGELKKEVDADRALGDKLGLKYTPCIIVCTQHEWIHVTKVDQLYQAIDQLEAKLGPAPVAAKKAAH
jgi:protein-disulfide isomerase